MQPTKESLLGSNGCTLAGDGLEAGLDGLHRTPGTNVKILKIFSPKNRRKNGLLDSKTRLNNPKISS
jgi:hypothetical protein